MNQLRTTALVASLTALGLAAQPALADTAVVSTAADTLAAEPCDDAPGSFRCAVHRANSDEDIDTIEFRRRVRRVTLLDSIMFTGGQALEIDGAGATIEGGGPFDLLETTGGGDFELRDITFAGPGDGACVKITVPGDAEDDVMVELDHVTLKDCESFGLWVDDNLGSEASLGVDIAWSRIVDNGLAGVDLDGIRVDEAGDGDITGRIYRSRFIGNGADGIEFDESGEGDATVTVAHSTFDGNGVSGLDTDDGFDIDEAGEGSIWLRVAHASFDANTDDGIGMDEADEGDVHMKLVKVNASHNGDKGVSVDEGGDGDFQFKFALLRADRNGLDPDDPGDGAKLEEVGAGDMKGRVILSSLSRNGDDGIDIEQSKGEDFENDAPGEGLLILDRVRLKHNGDNAVEPTNVEVIWVGGSS